MLPADQRSRRRLCITCGIFVVLFMLVIDHSQHANGQDFGFPEETDQKKEHKNADNRKPLYIPNRCAENEYLYPGDQKDDWVCDCKPGYVYHPDTSKCYLVYTRGPCKASEFLILAQGRPIPFCYPNQCPEGQVLFQARCHRLNEPGPCAFPELGNVVAVNVTTLLVHCQKKAVELINRFGDEEPVEGEIPYCAPGSKRNINGLCSLPIAIDM